MLNSVTASEATDSILDCTRRSSAVALSRSPIFAVQGLLFSCRRRSSCRAIIAFSATSFSLSVVFDLATDGGGCIWKGLTDCHLLVCCHWHHVFLIQGEEMISNDILDANDDIKPFRPHNLERVFMCLCTTEPFPMQGNRAKNFEFISIGIPEVHLGNWYDVVGLSHGFNKP